MSRQAILYRLMLPEHTCPFGVSAKQMLERHGNEVDDPILSSRGEKLGVDITPQVFGDGERIGGSDELEAYLSSSAE